MFLTPLQNKSSGAGIDGWQWRENVPEDKRGKI